MRAISNSSVLIALSSIGQLSILTQRFPDRITIPPAVWYEVVETGVGRIGAAEVAVGLNDWLSVQTVVNKALTLVLQQDLDQGEAEAIALWLEQPSDALLLDEKKARQVARRINLPTLGTLGLMYVRMPPPALSDYAVSCAGIYGRFKPIYRFIPTDRYPQSAPTNPPLSNRESPTPAPSLALIPPFPPPPDNPSCGSPTP